MYCPRCGVANHELALVCTSCGFDLGEPKRPATPLAQRTDTRSLTPQSVADGVFTYRIFEGPIVLLSFVYLLIAAGWVAFAYLAIPKIWQWATEGVIPFSRSEMASAQGYIAWGFAGLLILLGFVVIPLTRVFGEREVAFTARGISFRDRQGMEKVVISRLEEVRSRRSLTRLRGWTAHDRRVRRAVARNRLGKEQYRTFQESLARYLASTSPGP